MKATQPQLLDIALDPGDIVYTPDWVAFDMVSHFNLGGIILEPCKGNGAFTSYLPNAEWCEIEEGRDFFKWTKRVDWIIGNPPYRQLAKWLEHSFNLANDVVYLLPLNCIWNSMKRMKLVKSYGGIVEILAYGEGSIFGFGYGFAIGAIHFRKDYNGKIEFGLYERITNARNT